MDSFSMLTLSLVDFVRVSDVLFRNFYVFVVMDV